MNTAVIAPIVSSRRNGDFKQAARFALWPQELSFSVSLELQCPYCVGTRDEPLEGRSLWRNVWRCVPT